MRRRFPIVMAAFALGLLACRLGKSAPEPAGSVPGVGAARSGAPETSAGPTTAVAATVPRRPEPWSRAFAGVKILAMASGRDDDLIVAGAVSGTVDLGGGPVPGKGLSNAFVACYDRAGRHLWSRRFPGEGTQIATALAVDAMGRVVVTGTLDRVADFGGGPLQSEGLTDVFVVALDASGKHLWSRRFGDASEQEAGAVALAPDGSVLLTGSFDGSIDFGGGRLTSAGGGDVFVAKLDASGKHLWSKRSGDAHAQHGRALAVDADGDVVLAGDAQGALDFGGSAPASPDATGLFLARFDPGGRLLAGKRFPAEPRALVRPHAVAVDRTGAVVVAGALRGTSDLGGGPLHSAGATELDAFVAKLDASGAHVWSKRFGDGASQEVLALALDAGGAPWIAGRFDGSVDFGGGALKSAGKDDVFLAHLDASGAHLASVRFGDPDRQAAAGLALDRAGHAALAGDLRGSVDFGSGALAGPAGFLVRLGVL
jgi:outer membrane protein assembly factor BamB